MRFGQDPTFFDMLDRQAQIGTQAAQQFAGLSRDFRDREKIAAALRQLENDADALVHELVIKADAKFITPFDKEDIHALSHALDDVTDLVEAAGARVALYRLDAPRPDFAGLADLLRQAAEATAQGVAGLRDLRRHQEMTQALTNIHTLENQNDDSYRRALGDLFNEAGANPITVLKWKEIYDRIEIATDSCERVADLLESMVVKYA